MSTTDWFHEARFGMFIHWGPYSVAGRGEWVMNRERIPLAEYRAQCVEKFTAAKYDPASWAALAKEAGMKYVVLTTRHHDGFCLWDTKTTGWNAVQIGPHRDLVRPFVEAVRQAGLKVGFYYSVADWSHPDYPGAFHRDWPTSWPDDEARKRFVAYYRSQLEELLAGYGPIDLLWYDGCIPQPTDGGAINRWIKSIQPGILINNRNGEPFDFHCCEQAIKPAPPGTLWEACMTLNGNWGYHAGDHGWKNPSDVIRLLTETAAGAGNLLLNIGPRGDGSIPEESIRILRAVGVWLRENGEFLSNSTRSPFTWVNWGKLTTKGNTVYAHIFHSPGDELCIAEIRNKVLSVKLTKSGMIIPHKCTNGRLFIRGLPAADSDSWRMPVTLSIEVEGKPEAITPQGTFWIPE
jgi:alpha-L-fucosidase